MVIDHYKGTSLVPLFDTLGTIAQSLGAFIRNEAVVSSLMPLLFKKFDQIQDNERSIFAMFECFEAVVTSLGPSAEPFAPHLF
jgi:transportin-1